MLALHGVCRAPATPGKALTQPPSVSTNRQSGRFRNHWHSQGPIGLCATAGARLLGASTIISVDGNDHRLDISKKMEADITLNFSNCDVVAEIMRLTGGRGADSANEALGTQATFESALRVLKPGGTLSSLGVYSKDLTIPMSAFAAGLGDHKINTALCPGGKERMHRLMNVVASGCVDLGIMVTHEYKLENIVAAYDLFSNQREGVLKIAIKP
jgi:threonine dehydrogenase-like Zn-dependent dehydrogenase